MSIFRISILKKKKNLIHNIVSYDQEILNLKDLFLFRFWFLGF